MGVVSMYDMCDVCMYVMYVMCYMYVQTEWSVDGRTHSGWMDMREGRWMGRGIDWGGCTGGQKGNGGRYDMELWLWMGRMDIGDVASQPWRGDRMDMRGGTE